MSNLIMMPATGTLGAFDHGTSVYCAFDHGTSALGTTRVEAARLVPAAAGAAARKRSRPPRGEPR